MKKTACMAILMVIGVSLPASATTWFSESMEDYAVGTAITSSTPTHNGGAWVVTYGTYADTSATVIADPTGSGKGNVVELIDQSASQKATLAPDMISTETGPVLFAYDIYVPADSELMVSISAVPGMHWKTTYLTAWSEPWSSAFRDLPDGVWDILFTFTPDTWYHVEMSAHAVAERLVDIKVTDQGSGTVVVDEVDRLFNLDSSAGTPTAYQYLKFSSVESDDTHNVYLDNIQIIPEPASIALVLAGGILGLRSRRRR